jgi:hypothetical protein
MTPAEQAERIIDDWNNGIPHQYSEVIDVVLALANQIAEHQRVNETFAGFDELKAEIHLAAVSK